MKKNSILILIALILSISCVSKTQQKGLDEIAELYNAETGYSKGFFTEEGKKYSYYEAVVSKSKMLDTLDTRSSCSNIAFMLYDNLNEKERNAYDYIRVQLRKNNDTVIIKFKPDALKIGAEQAKIFDEFSNHLLKNEYHAIKKMVDPNYIPGDVDKRIKKYMDPINSYHGNPKSYKRTIFTVSEQKNGENLLTYKGFLSYSDGYHKNYYINVPLETTDKKIKGLRFLKDKL